MVKCVGLYPFNFRPKTYNREENMSCVYVFNVSNEHKIHLQTNQYTKTKES